jgi:3-oxoacyl-[acyl-carrier protein] reductase
MDLGLSGRAAVVTAASKGLGRATALALAAEGCDVVVSSRGGERLEAVAEEARALGVRAVAVTADAHDPTAGERVVQTALDAFGRLDVAVANAGGPPPARALDLDDAAILDAVEANLLASVRLVRAAVPPMRAGGWGRLLCITSHTVKQPAPGLALSNTARTGLYAWCKTAAQDLVADGITLNLLCPGLHRTDRVIQLHGGTAPDVPLGEPEDFGATAAFLCSAQAAFITGTAVLIDGGATLGL